MLKIDGLRVPSHTRIIFGEDILLNIEFGDIEYDDRIVWLTEDTKKLYADGMLMYSLGSSSNECFYIGFGQNTKAIQSIELLQTGSYRETDIENLLNSTPKSQGVPKVDLTNWPTRREWTIDPIRINESKMHYSVLFSTNSIVIAWGGVENAIHRYYSENIFFGVNKEDQIVYVQISDINIQDVKSLWNI